jgi:hypothetical protein
VVHKEEWLHYAPWNAALAKSLGAPRSLDALPDDGHVTVYSLGLPRHPILGAPAA